MTLNIQAENISGNMMFGVPYMTVDPLREKLKSGMQFDVLTADSQWSRRLSTEVMEAPLETTVEMGNAYITLRELLELAPGDTIVLDKACSSDMIIRVEGVPKYFGIPGIKHGNKAVQISKICNDRGQ
jgi:flagellar motor switch protein FliM